jgi:hypothetical protein
VCFNAAELCSAWTAGGGRPYVGIRAGSRGGGHPYTSLGFADLGAVLEVVLENLRG